MSAERSVKEVVCKLPRCERERLSKGVNIGVTTTHGVVALTGTLTSQNAIDHVKDVAGKVKDVKSVDTSALVLASL